MSAEALTLFCLPGWSCWLLVPDLTTTESTATPWMPPTADPGMCLSMACSLSGPNMPLLRKDVDVGTVTPVTPSAFSTLCACG